MRELLPDDAPPEMEFEQMFRQAFVDLSKPVPPPPVAISIGEHEYRQERHPNVFATYGNISAIIGDSKTRKSFMKSLLMAAYIGGKTNYYASDITTHRNEDKVILDFDTEQSKYHSLRSFKRVEYLVGKRYENYIPFCLRQFTNQERLDFIEYCIMDKYRDVVGLVSIDGYADLLPDTNDPILSNLLVHKLMKWSDVTQCHITGILHTTSGTTKAKGHLGSFLQQKCETVCVLSKEEELTKVHFKYTRGFGIDDFGFVIDEDGLPKVVELTEENF